MMQILSQIGPRCYASAVRRKKAHSALDCIQAMAEEQAEYWDAMDKGKRVSLNPDIDIKIQTTAIQPDSEFVKYYNANFHNTELDELADIVIVAGTWAEESHREQGDENYNPYRNIDTMLAAGALQFMNSQLITREQIDWFNAVLKMKMRYNELRKD